MRDLLFLASRYLRFHKWKTGILIGSISLVLFVPAGLTVLVQLSEKKMRSRAEATPLVVGSRGSRVDLVLNALYFETKPPEKLTYSEVRTISDSGRAVAIPLHTRFRSEKSPIVGTTLEYFEFRNLDTRHGRRFSMLGECVVGSRVAAERDLRVGSKILTSSENPFDFAGAYPLRMSVAGILEASGTADDSAIFVDLKTAWIIEGLGHGHDDLTKASERNNVRNREGNEITANPSVVQYNEITRENVASFHFHGDANDFPIHAVIVVPNSRKSAALLEGRYQNTSSPVQIAVPTETVSELLATVVRIENVVLVASLIVGFATLLTAVLVFALSARLRRNEFLTIARIGGSRRLVAGLIIAEVVIVTVVAAIIATLLTASTALFSETFLRWVIQ